MLINRMLLFLDSATKCNEKREKVLFVVPNVVSLFRLAVRYLVPIYLHFIRLHSFSNVV